MSTDHEDRYGHGRYGPPTDQPPNRHRRFVVATVGLAALLGTGAYVLTSRVIDGNRAAETRTTVPIVAPEPGTEPRVVTRPAPPAAQTPSSGTAATAATLASSPSAHTTTPAPAPTVPEKVKDEIKAAREDAAKDGYPLRRALTPKGGQSIAASQRSETTPQGTLRVTTARGDLTGQREMLWAGDNGVAVGDARCTQKFRFSAGDEPRERPTMMLCWRTSAARSVVTLAVSKHGRPSAASNADVIAREWSLLD